MRTFLFIWLIPLVALAQTRIPVGKDDFTLLIFEESVIDSEPTNDEFVVFAATGKGTFKQNNKILRVKQNKLSQGKREATLLVITQNKYRHEIILYPEAKPAKLTHYFDAGQPLFGTGTNGNRAKRDNSETANRRTYEAMEIP